MHSVATRLQLPQIHANPAARRKDYFSASSYTFKTRVGQACKQLDTIATSFCRKTLKLVGRTMLLEAMSWLGLLGISCSVQMWKLLHIAGTRVTFIWTSSAKPMRRRRKTGTLISMDSEQRCHQIHLSFCMQRIMTSSDKQSQCHSWLKSRCPLSCTVIPLSIINSYLHCHIDSLSSMTPAFPLSAFDLWIYGAKK